MSQEQNLPTILEKNEIKMNNDTVAGFEAMQRYAMMLSQSKLIPQNYRGKENIPDIMIAVDIARRIGASDLMVMQNLYLVHGFPSWSSKFLIATFNKCGKCSTIKYRFVGKKDADSYGCVAWAVEKETNEVVEGPEVTIKMAKNEGWFSKKDKFGKECSKWQTMPQLMLMYRAATLLIRTHYPELSFGFYTDDEVNDSINYVQNVKGNFVHENSLQIEDIAVPVDVETGEVLEKNIKQSNFFDSEDDDDFYKNKEEK